MTERQSTPDLLATLMSAQSTTSVVENNKSIKQERHKAIKPASNKAIKKECNKARTSQSAIDETKEKATFNLSKQLLDELEDNWTQLRKDFGSKQISKTLIVETALHIAFDEYETIKQESKLYSRLASNNAIKQ